MTLSLFALSTCPLLGVLKVHTALMLEQGIDLIEDTWGNNMVLWQE